MGLIGKYSIDIWVEYLQSDVLYESCHPHSNHGQHKTPADLLQHGEGALYFLQVGVDHLNIDVRGWGDMV
jgi:hypothetical protein